MKTAQRLLTRLSTAGLIFITSPLAHADITLLGSNAPHANVNDGDFDLVPGWAVHDSPHWTVNRGLTRGGGRAGVAKGVFTSAGNPLTVVDSNALNSTPAGRALKIGDVLQWRLVAKAEHACDAKASCSLIFGEHTRTVADQTPLTGGPQDPAVIEGAYTVTEEDAAAGMPLVRLSLYGDQSVSILVHGVDLILQDTQTAGPQKLEAATTNRGVALTWPVQPSADGYRVYRKTTNENKYRKIADGINDSDFVDPHIINGLTYTYLVTAVRNGIETSASPLATARRTDTSPPSPPIEVAAVGTDSMIELSWTATDPDIAGFNIYRSDEAGNTLPIGHGVAGNRFIDDMPAKNQINTYTLQAVDHSGNTSGYSKPVAAKTKAVLGASFSDLIRPMPIHRALRADLWGADNVLPRDPDNGIEHPDWSYWGGRPVKDKGNKYHMLVVRWPEGATKGHWAWPHSTVVHAVSETPTGPYTPTGDSAYKFAHGKGHNADVTFLNDGRYLLYSLINWKPVLLTSDSMSGPWTVEGEMQIEYDAEALGDQRAYQAERNLSGVQLEDGSMLWVTKFGRMIKSESGLLGPYKVLTDVVQANETIPERYRQSNYEDPVMWRDDVQFHQIINAFLDYRAIYLRSPDGIHWKYDTGLAYTPQSTFYENGTRTHWYKLERPHVLQDEHGRATHLSLAAIDVIKRQDFANDKHSAKNLIIPLTVHKRLTMLNKLPVDANTTTIKLLVHAEPGFDPAQNLDLGSLRFGASEQVNFGHGCKVRETQSHPDGLILVFDGEGNGITQDNFAGKLIGQTVDGDLVVGFSKLKAD